MHLHRTGVFVALAMACAITAPAAASAATHHAVKPPKAKPGQKILKSTAKTPTGYTCQRKRINGRMWKVCVKQAAAPTPTTQGPGTNLPTNSSASTDPPTTPATETTAASTSGGGGTPTPPTPPAPVTSTVYSNNTFPNAFVSQAFEADGIKEFGGKVTLGPGARSNAVVSTVISSYACQSGGWSTGDCLTPPGATYNLPMYLSVYRLDSNGTVGTLVARTLQTQTIAFRPSHDTTGFCSTQQFIDAGGTCRYNYPTQVSFDLGSAVLPTDVIITLAFNTNTAGWEPTGVPGPADSTNIAVVPTVAGPNVYQAAAGDLALQPVDSGGYQPTFRVVTTG
jgi:hypothetical protein